MAQFELGFYDIIYDFIIFIHITLLYYVMYDIIDIEYDYYAYYEFMAFRNSNIIVL
jgi:hypothetical protein